jgi:hypothetical protein
MPDRVRKDWSAWGNPAPCHGVPHWTECAGAAPNTPSVWRIKNSMTPLRVIKSQ